MSGRKRDLIERVKYPNPLPLPPYPPKLLTIPLAPERYAHPSFGNRLASEVPIPLLADAEAGIHLDLPGAFPGLWLNDSSAFSLGPGTSAPPDLQEVEVHAADAFLLQDFSLVLQQQPGGSGAGAGGSAAAAAMEGGAGGTTAAAAAAMANHLQNQHAAALGPLARTSLGANDVTWLRRTEYLSAEAKRQRAQEIKQRVQEQVDVSREAQVKAISQTFDAIHLGPGGRAPSAAPLSSLRHPTKEGVHAVEAFEVLPDPETWATDIDLVRFLDWPGRTSKGGKPVPDPRLDVQLLRPHAHTEANQVISVYMPSGEFNEAEVDVVPEGGGVEDIGREYEEAKKAAEALPEEAPAEPAEGEARQRTRKEALEAAEARRTMKLALHAYIHDTRAAIASLSQTEREDLAAARFAKRRRTGVFPDEVAVPAAALAPAVASSSNTEGEEKEKEEEEQEQGEDGEGEPNALPNTIKAAFSTRFVHVRDYEPSTESGASASTAGQLVFVFDDGAPDEEVVRRSEAPLRALGYEDTFPPVARAKYGELDVGGTDPFTGAPAVGDGADGAVKEDKDKDKAQNGIRPTAPPQSRIERTYRAKLLAMQGEEAMAARREMEREAPRSTLKAAYYHPIRMSFKLRMKRYNRTEKPADHEDFWDNVEITQRHLAPNEVYERLAKRKVVDDFDDFVLRVEEEEEEEGEGEVDMVDEGADGEGLAGDAEGDADGEADADGDGDAEGEDLDAEAEADEDEDAS